MRVLSIFSLIKTDIPTLLICSGVSRKLERSPCLLMFMLMRTHETDSEPDTEEGESELEIVKESEKAASSKKVTSVKTVQKKNIRQDFPKRGRANFRM